MASDFNPAETPLLLIAWRRPHTLRQIIDAIRSVGPTRLFVACDGPNPERLGEAEKVDSTRAVIENEIDWPCQIERLYSDVNLGCSIGPIRAITWFFEQVEEGIILEDDCIPHPDFFNFCTTLLERYRHDTRVWCIGGNNFQNGKWRGDGSYYFSHYPHCWGWASWRRCWQHFDAKLSNWHALRDSGLLETIFDDPVERQFWSRSWQGLLDTGQIDIWDYQWTFTCFANRGLTALPNQNLVSNVGFGPDGTHTLSPVEPMPIDKGLKDIRPPAFILRDCQADRYTFDHHCGGIGIRAQSRLGPRLRRLTKRVISKAKKLLAPPASFKFKH